MWGRRRSGTKVADAHQVVEASWRQQESPTPTQWCGKVTRPCRRTVNQSSSWGRPESMHTSLPEFRRPRQRSTQFCSAGFSLCRISSLLLFCAATRANYFLRVVQPAWSERFAAAHDENVWNCTQELLDIEGTVRVRQSSCLPLALGRLGLRSAIRSQNAAYWASWADSLPQIRERHPDIADQIPRGQQPSGRSGLQRTASGCAVRCFARGQRPTGSPQNTFRVVMLGKR